MTDYDYYVGAMHDLDYAISVSTNFKQRQALSRAKDIFKKFRPNYPGEHEEDKLSNKLVFENTCSACPEQYDVKLNGQIVGYVRLRSGNLRVDCPDCGGETVYETYFEDPLKGMFDDDEERQHYFSEIEKAILKWHQNRHVQ